MKTWIAAGLLWLTAIGLHSVGLRAEEVASPTKAQDAELRRQLLERMKVDQDVRTGAMNWFKQHGIRDAVDPKTLSEALQAELARLDAEFKQVDSDNTRWLKEVVQKRGWPTRTLVGKEGAAAAWLLVQHADSDPQFQRTCLGLMNKLPKDQVSQENLAYLTDRVLLAEGKKQRYGTQFIWVDRKLKPRPIEDEANVDKLRNAAGLPPLAEYLKEAEEIYGGKSE